MREMKTKRKYKGKDISRLRNEGRRIKRKRGKRREHIKKRDISRLTNEG
jgi:hypothetical protein